MAYKEWQPLYDGMKEKGLVEVFMPGIEDVIKEVDGITPLLLILDDWQQKVAKNDFVSSMFILGSHHRNCSCVFIVQNLYFQGSKARVIAINARYYVIFMRLMTNVAHNVMKDNLELDPDCYKALKKKEK